METAKTEYATKTEIREIVREVIDEIREYIDIQVRVLTTAIDDTQTGLKELDHKVDIVREELKDIRKDISGLKDEVVDLRCDVALLYRKTRSLEKQLN